MSDAPCTASDTEAFERAAAAFVVAAADALPPDLRVLAFVSPLCARSPDLSDIWHPVNHSDRAAETARNLVSETVRQRALGAARALKGRSRYAYAVHGDPGDNVLVLTSVVGGEDASGRYGTPYVSTRPPDALFVFGDAGTCGPGETHVVGPRPTETIAIGTTLLDAGRAAAEACGERGDRLDLLSLTWEAWAYSATWVHELVLKRELSAWLGTHREVARVGCVHEMHAYARAVWRAAAARAREGRTVQHAAAPCGKRWYFPEAAELDAGLRLPDAFFVFSERDRDLLSPRYPGTRFDFGCSSRYAYLRDLPLPPAAPDGHVLFAGSLAAFDNDALVNAVRGYEGRRRVRVRLHPHAQLSRGVGRWLSDAAAAGDIELSQGATLTDDLAGAAVVVGMGTTVLEEALALGRPVVQLTDGRYVLYVDTLGAEGATRVDAALFSSADVEEAVGSPVDVATARHRLGLDAEEVTWERLFA